MPRAVDVLEDFAARIIAIDGITGNSLRTPLPTDFAEMPPCWSWVYVGGEMYDSDRQYEMLLSPRAAVGTTVTFRYEQDVRGLRLIDLGEYFKALLMGRLWGNFDNGTFSYATWPKEAAYEDAALNSGLGLLTIGWLLDYGPFAAGL